MAKGGCAKPIGPGRRCHARHDHLRRAPRRLRQRRSHGGACHSAQKRTFFLPAPTVCISTPHGLRR